MVIPGTNLETRTFTTPRGAGMNFIDAGPRSDEVVLMLHGNPTWSDRKSTRLNSSH